MLDQDTKRRIDNACDILVGKVPTPLAQVEQITLALIYKFMNDMDKRALAMGGQASYFIGDYEKYSWDNLMDNRIGAQERANLYEEGLAKLSTNGELPDLFRGIFKEANIPYRSARTLNLFLKEIDGFSYGDSENLGDAYEYLLGKTGSQGEAGQFRTPRHIIDFIVQVVDPSKYDNILDPACGTAGFLISALKHIYKANTKEIEGDLLSPVEQLGLSNSVYGYDITPDMVRISRVNMFLHNIRLPHIYEYDTLSSLDRWDDNFSCILANPPFMTPKGGVTPHNRFSIPSTRSEVLFVDYIMEHLTLDGKAGVIVPEGIIFQSGSAYKALRKKLVTENYLWAVVSLPGGVFNPYSGVKTSILLIDRQIAKRSDKIIFLKVENDGYNLGAQRRPIDANDLPHAAAQALAFKQAVMKQTEYVAPDKGVVLVEKKKLAENGDYNLSGERYQESKSIISDFPVVQLGELETQGKIKFLRGQGLSKRDIVKDGANKCIHYGDIYTIYQPIIKEVIGKTDFNGNVRSQKGDVLVPATTTADALGIAVARSLNEDNVVLGSDINIVRTNNEYILSDFLAMLINYPPLKIDLAAYAKGANILHISNNDIRRLRIPLPPLSVQEEIVSELDSYQKIINGAKQVVDNWKPRINIDPEWSIVRIKDVCSVNPESSDPAELYKDWFTYVDIASIDNTTNSLAQLNRIPVSGVPSRARRIVKPNDVIISTVRPNLKAFYYFDEVPERAIVSTGFAVLRASDRINPRFMYYMLLSDYMVNQMISRMGKGSYPSINQNDVNELTIPLPDLRIQQAVVERIKNEQKLVDVNREIIKLYEHKIKDRIDRLWKS